MLLSLLDKANTIDQFWEDFERIQEEMTSNLFRSGGLDAKNPPSNIQMKENEIVLTAILPGVNPDKLEILVEENKITIQGKQESEKPEGNFEIYRQESFSREFKRSFELPFRLDSEKSNATYENGVLTLVLQRDELDKPKKINIQAK
jgi:HSP20 family protein